MSASERGDLCLKAVWECEVSTSVWKFNPGDKMRKPVSAATACMLTGLVLICTASTAHASQVSYTYDQALAGKRLYQQACTNCHGQQLKGGEGAPGLAGQAFIERWQARSLAEFANANLVMALSNPGALPVAEYEALIAFILSQNGLPPGAKPLHLKAAERSPEPLAWLGAEPPLQLLQDYADTKLDIVEWLHHLSLIHI